MRVITRILAFIALWITPALGQFVSTLAPNMYPVCDEKCIITSAPANAMWQFGFGTSWSALAVQSYPLVADCSIACPQWGGDPDPGIAKTVYVQQQNVAFTVAWVNSSGVVTMMTIPAISAAVSGAAATSSNTQTVSTQPVTATLSAPSASCTIPRNGGTCKITFPTVTVPGQTLSLPSNSGTYAFTCSGTDMQHLSCSVTKQ